MHLLSSIRVIGWNLCDDVSCHELLVSFGHYCIDIAAMCDRVSRDLCLLGCLKAGAAADGGLRIRVRFQAPVRRTAPASAFDEMRSTMFPHLVSIVDSTRASVATTSHGHHGRDWR